MDEITRRIVNSLGSLCQSDPTKGDRFQLDAKKVSGLSGALQHATQNQFDDFGLNTDARTDMVNLGTDRLRYQLLIEFLKRMSCEDVKDGILLQNPKVMINSQVLTGPEAMVLVIQALKQKELKALIQALPLSPAFVQVLCDSLVATRISNPEAYQEIDQNWQTDPLLQPAVVQLEKIRNERYIDVPVRSR